MCVCTCEVRYRAILQGIFITFQNTMLQSQHLRAASVYGCLSTEISMFLDRKAYQIRDITNTVYGLSLEKHHSCLCLSTERTRLIKKPFTWHHPSPLPHPPCHTPTYTQYYLQWIFRCNRLRCHSYMYSCLNVSFMSISPLLSCAASNRMYTIIYMSESLQLKRNIT